MKIKFIAVFAASLFLLTSCAPTFDGSSESSFEQSREVIEAEISEKEKETLEVALRVLLLKAMSDKWLNQRHKDKSFDDIVLTLIDGKTYADVLELAEEFLVEKHQKEVEENKEALRLLEEEYQQAKESFEVLNAIKITSIAIVKGPWYPTIELQLENKSQVTLTGESWIRINIGSIKYNKTVDTRVDSVKSPDPIKPGDELRPVKISLSSLMDRSKRLKSMLKEPSYPITDLEAYDLTASIQAVKLNSIDGVEYKPSEISIDEYENKIKETSDHLSELMASQPTLEELTVLENSNDSSDIESEAFNESYLSLLESVRKSQKGVNITQQHFQFPGDAVMYFSDVYSVYSQRHPGMYRFVIGENLEFNNEDPNLEQFQIKDNNYVEYRSDSEKSSGIINVLYKPEVTYDLQGSIDYQVKKNYRFNIIDYDENGYIHEEFDRCNLFRYFSHNGYHYLYTMKYPSFEECIIEFDRSKGMFKPN